MGTTKWSTGAASPDGHDGFDGWSCVVLWLSSRNGMTRKEDDRGLLAAQDGRNRREGSCCRAMARQNMMKLLSRNKGRMSPNVLRRTT